MPNEHGVECSPQQHANDGDNDLHQPPGGLLAVPNAEHVGYGLEQSIDILGARVRILQQQQKVLADFDAALGPCFSTEISCMFSFS